MPNHATPVTGWTEIIGKYGFATFVSCVLMAFFWWLTQEIMIPVKDKHIELIGALQENAVTHGILMHRQVEAMEAVEKLSAEILVEQRETRKSVKKAQQTNLEILEQVTKPP